MRTVSWKDNMVVLIDQTKLPDRLEYIQTDDIERVATAIQRLEVRGAPAIGVTAAYGMSLAALQSRAKTREEFLAEMIKTHDFLASTRPTAINLFWALDHMLAFTKQELSKGMKPADMGNILLAEANRMAEEDVAICKRVAELGSELIPDGANVLTHCNTGFLATVGFGTAVSTAIVAHNQGKKVHVYTDETRPRLQGAKLNVWELAREGVPYTLITDNTAAWMMAQGKVDLIVIGPDRVVANGDTAAKIGVYGLAVLAHYHHIPIYAITPTSTIDMSVACGKDIPIEERDPDEVRVINGQCITLPDANVLNYAFDVTPNELITAIVTEKGIVYPPYTSELAKLMGS
jgi:methylthioribose-1-phosphate isomerase